MRTAFIATAICGALVAPAATAMAQSWAPGSELIGHSAQVSTNGVVNTVHFDPGGAARVVSPGGTVVQGTWSAGNGTLCLNTGAAQECWPYTMPFQSGQPVTLTSNCQAVSTWTAMSTNAPPAPEVTPERG